MKNQTKRVEDAKAASPRNKRPRIGDEKKKSKALTAADIERAKAARLMRVDNQVWDIIRAAKVAEAKREAAREGDPLEQPFKNDRERLLFNKQKYAGMTILQAFAAGYGMLVDPGADINLGNDVPTELSVGDVISLTISSISKENGTIFNSGAYKENFATRNNLARFEKFSKVLPIEPVKVRVVETGSKATMVDVLGLMVGEFVLPRTARPWIQNRVFEPCQPVLVKDLHLVKGGYIGKAVIPNVSEFVGEDYEIDAFVPGSQIVLNTTDNFEQFEGATVHAFIASYAPKPNGRGMSLVCSVKNYLKHHGNMNLRQLHSMWCDADEKWETMSQTPYDGIITGVLNSAKKCGVFVEIPDLCITGMIPAQPEELVNYAAGEHINVRIKNLEEDMTFNDAVGQMQRLQPFEIVDGAIKRVNVKPVLEQVI